MGGIKLPTFFSEGKKCLLFLMIFILHFKNTKFATRILLLICGTVNIKLLFYVPWKITIVNVETKRPGICRFESLHVWVKPNLFIY